jgi:hypothetical protein
MGVYFAISTQQLSGTVFCATVPALETASAMPGVVLKAGESIRTLVSM